MNRKKQNAEKKKRFLKEIEKNEKSIISVKVIIVAFG